MTQEPNTRLIGSRPASNHTTESLEPERILTWAVVGVGNSGCNVALSWAMAETGLSGSGRYSFINSDWVALANCENAIREQRSELRTQCYRLGNGVSPGSESAIGARLARAAMPKLRSSFEGVNVVFLVACLGGGTGSGAAPVIARAARASGARVVALVNMPFNFEGEHPQSTAHHALCELRTAAHDIAILQLQDFMCDEYADIDQDVAFDLVGETMRAHVQKELAGLINAREFSLLLPRHKAW